MRGVSDATFSIASATGSGSLPPMPTIAFYGGFVNTSLAAQTRSLYRIDSPADAARWISSAIHATGVVLYIQQGTLPTASQYHYRSSGANSSINQFMLATNSWPWLPNRTFYLAVTNTTASSQSFTFVMDGKSVETDDADGDGLPDAWERQYFGNTTSQGGSGDPDGDGLNNLAEEQQNRNPVVPDRCFLVSLLLGTGGAAVEVEGPPGPRYMLQVSSNLFTWQDLYPFTNTTGRILLPDPAATNQRERHYRGVVQP